MATATVAQPQSLLPAFDEQPQQLTLDPTKKGLDLPSDLQESLRYLAIHFGKQEQWARLQEVREAWEQRLLLTNKQHIFWNDDQKSFQIPGGSPRGQSIGGLDASISAEMPTFTRAYNIYLAYAKSFEAVFCQNQPNLRIEPLNPTDPADVTAVPAAEQMKRIVEKQNPPRAIQVEIARLLWTDNRVIAHTYLDEAEQQERIEIYGTLESRVPMTQKKFKKWPSMALFSEVDITIAKDDYQECADKITAGTASPGEEEYSRLARLSVSQGTIGASQGGDSHSFMVTRQYRWYRPAAFNALKDSPKSDELKRLFPNGVRVTFCGSSFCEAIPESMDDRIAVLHALEGDGQNRPSLGSPEVPVQKIFNDLMNMAEEAAKYCIPATWCDDEAVDTEAIQEQQAAYGAHYPATKKTGEALADSFYTEIPVELPQSVNELMTVLQGPLSQFLTGQQPALFGGEMDDAGKTATGYAQARDQALGLMGLMWLPFCTFWALVMSQAVKAARGRRENAKALLSSPDTEQDEIVDVSIQDLKGNVLAYSETDGNFPESYTAKSNKWMQLAQMADQNPVVAQILMHPDNMGQFKDAVGLEDMVIPQADSEEKQLEEIAQMLKSGPVPPSPEELMAALAGSQVSGQEPNPDDLLQSSVPIDPIFDDHDAEFAVVKRWINSEEGRKAKREDPDGFNNVRLHGLAHQKLMMAAQAAQQAAMAPPILPPGQDEGKEAPKEGNNAA